MLSKHHALQQQVPHVWKPGHAYPLQYQPMSVQGHVLPMIILQDNQHYQHQFGYHVLSPLLVAPGNVLLVDRGWVVGDVTRRTFPAIDPLNEAINIRGSAYYPSKKSWVLGQSMEKIQNNMVVVELIDTQLLSQFLHKSVYPFIIRLGKLEKHGFTRQWAVVAMPPERHYGYALQWFAMAAIVVILMLVLNIRKKHEKNP
jgi:surfeit locus 1 family protein